MPEGDVNPDKPESCALYHCPQCGSVMKPTPLTLIEIDVLRAYASGLTTSEIAALRFVASKTIEAHRQKILLKMGTRNMIAAVVAGIKQGVVLIDRPAPQGEQDG